MKKCFKCGIEKSIDKFYVHEQMGDGHLGKCKSCAKKDVHERYNNPEARERIREYERLRFQNPDRKKKVYLYAKKRKTKYKGKNKAHQKVANAIRAGRLVRKPCEVCGNPKSQGHHEDYRKPLEVIWLCFKHHRERHGQKVIVSSPVVRTGR